MDICGWQGRRRQDNMQVLCILLFFFERQFYSQFGELTLVNLVFDVVGLLHKKLHLFRGGDTKYHEPQ